MFAWGSVTIGLGGVQSYASLAVVRLLLGIFEAGLFPGLVYYLTFWYRPEERSLRVALILASATLAGAFGGAIAYGVSHMDYLHGLSAWRWLFILEGVPSAGLAVPILFLLPDYPETARWLTEGERERAVERLSAGGSKASSSGLTWADVRDTVFSARLWTHYVVRAMRLEQESGAHAVCRSTSGSLRRSPACRCLRQPLCPDWGIRR